MYSPQQCVKLLAFGLKGYFGSWRNIADTLISLLGLCYVIWALVVLGYGYTSVAHQVVYIYRIVRMSACVLHYSMHLFLQQTRINLANIALTYAVLKCFTILGKYVREHYTDRLSCAHFQELFLYTHTRAHTHAHTYTLVQSIMQNLTITVVRTLIGSIPLMCVLFFIILTYSFVGVIIFANLRTGEDITFSRVNFNGAFPSFYLAFRVMTGEDWHHLMRDAMVRPAVCVWCVCVCVQFLLLLSVERFIKLCTLVYYTLLICVCHKLWGPIYQRYP